LRSFLYGFFREEHEFKSCSFIFVFGMTVIWEELTCAAPFLYSAQLNREQIYADICFDNEYMILLSIYSGTMKIYKSG
jgi:hypothetical protein